MTQHGYYLTDSPAERLAKAFEALIPFLPTNNAHATEAILAARTALAEYREASQ